MNSPFFLDNAGLHVLEEGPDDNDLVVIYSPKFQYSMGAVVHVTYFLEGIQVYGRMWILVS